MLHSRRRMLKFSSFLFGSIMMDRKGFAVEIRQNESGQNRQELERIARTFEYGVASGDPMADRVILWTHVSAENSSPIPLRWQVSLDVNFYELVAEGETFALAENDFTVKVDAVLPFPATSYYYRFFAMDCWSMIGRTRTTPIQRQNIRLAVVSCSSIWSGYFNAYEALSQRNDLDAIIHVGDYIYDFVDEDEKINLPFDAVNMSVPNSLEAIRQRYRYYRKDPFLRRAHQQHPWIIVWDNHDIDNLAGKVDSIRAFHEWVPIRSPNPGNPNLIYRRLSFGPMLDLLMLDTRHIGRDSISQQTGQASILGDQQFQWLETELLTSQAHWLVIGNQVLMAPCQILGNPISTQMWDGYAADRARVLQVLQDNSINNTIVVTGDAHLSFAANIELDGKPVAVEFLPSSVTRGNLDEQVKSIFKGIANGGFSAAVKLFNPHIRYFESTRHGYGIVDLRTEGATMEFWYVPHEQLSQDQDMARAVYVASGEQRITQENANASRGIKLASQAPQEPRLYQSPGEIGGTGGGYFDDAELFDTQSRLIRVKVRGGDRIDAIATEYSNGSVHQHGGTGGQEKALELNPGEYLRRIMLALGKHKGRTTVHYLKLSTNQGRVLEAGKNTGNTIEYVADADRHIVGFRGRSGKEIDKLGPIFAPDFA